MEIAKMEQVKQAVKGALSCLVVWSSLDRGQWFGPNSISKVG